MAAQGFSVVELGRAATRQPWRYVRGAARNRRITARTPFRMTGPAAGSDLLKTADDRSGRRVIGTFANCSGGTTPWGTILSGEENFHGYFVADSTAVGGERYGLRNRSGVYGWEAVDPRFDATQPDYAAEPHRFGYIIEIDPTIPSRRRVSTPHLAGSSTKVPTSASTLRERLPRTWVTTNASSTCTSSLPRRSTDQAIHLARGGTIYDY